ncbi:hypothetical protein C8J57DRAFT_1316859 [Mycena rebaudengoi]|nr:hypothetical protein C8J57DRAFT_1316859 [Mycena rebaudengoi]
MASPSPFDHLLRTNYIPTFAEAAEIRGLCSSSAEELARLEAEISRTQTILYDLQRSYRRLKSTVDAHLALLSPMRDLPPEVLQLIFTLTLPSNRNAVMHASEAPVLLGRVCSGWRRIAFATPALWASIHVVCPPMDYLESASAPTRVKCEAMEAWLGRSGACPLSISIWVSHEAGFAGAAVAAASPFVEAVLPLSRRWKHIELRVPTDSLDSFHYLQGIDTPLLQTIAIKNGGSLSRDDWSGNLLFLQNAPRLYALSLTHEGNVDLPSFSWAQLTELSLLPTQEFFGLNTAMTLDVLQQCINLRMCTLHFPSVANTHNTALVPPEVFTIPRLSFLSVRATHFSTSDPTLANIFDHLVLPSLQTIVVEDCDGELNIINALERLLSRSPCCLQKLSLKDITATTAELISLLSLSTVRSITDLVIYDRNRDWRDDGGYMLSDAFIRAMAVTDSNVLCPSLQVVQFAQCTDFSDDILLEFLQSRAHPPKKVARLRSVDIALDHAIEIDLEAAMRQLTLDGVEVILRPEDDSWVDVRVSPWEGLAS